MKFTLKWLNEHLDHNSSLNEILNALTNLGIEVEGVEDYLEKYKSFKVAYIEEAEKHPNADKLVVCKVQTSEGLQQIVCGAPNARAGIYVIHAPVGTYIETANITMKQTEIRGVASSGMMLSEKELGISDEHGSIMEFVKGEVGQPAVEILGLDDIVIDISITPNRGDLLGVRGIARDLAAYGIGTLKPVPQVSVDSIKELKISDNINTEISERFYLYHINNISNCESPQWLQNRLKLIGLTPRSAVVDITNYILFSMNQPLHAYDISKLKNKDTLKVSPCPTTTYKALDEEEYSVDESIPGIFFGDELCCLAGIKGSLGSGCDIETSEIYLEAAHFNHIVLSYAKRNVGINTDSAYRFEREIDILSIETAIKYAAKMLQEICGANIESVYRFASKEDALYQREFEVKSDEVSRMLGDTVSSSTIVNVLNNLSYSYVQNEESFKVVIPSYRNDILLKEDLIAEIIRILGVHNLPSQDIISGINSFKKTLNKNFNTTLKLKKAAVKQGFYETINMSFISNQIAEDFQVNNPVLKLLNPISEELSVMRTSIIPSLVGVAKKNINYQVDSLSIFEVANVYDESCNHHNMIGMLLMGNKHSKNWLQEEEKYTVWDIKSATNSIIDEMGFTSKNLTYSKENLPFYYHPTRSSALMIGRNIVGYIGEINPFLSKKMGIVENLFFSELYVDKLPFPENSLHKKSKYKFIDLLFVHRDFSFILDNSIAASDLIRLTEGIDKKIISNVEIVDVYQGKNIPEGSKSISMRVTLQPYNKTFTDEEITEVCNNIINTITKKFKATIRNG